MSAGPLGVGFLGGGPATWAIHLPTLATMPDLFRVVRVMDVDPAVLERVTSSAVAGATTDPAAVLDDPAIDVVAVCSPDQFHADQVIAACEAGKRAVLCEKPLTLTRDDAARIVAAATAAGTHVMVGTMHCYDPAFRAALAAWTDLGETATLVRSTIFLPENGLFVEQATDAAAPETPFVPPAEAVDDPSFQAMMLRFAILGLAIHDLPLVRDVFPGVGEVRLARYVPPFGYVLALSDGDRSAELLAYMDGTWPPHWEWHAVGRSHELRVQFPPSYVLAGSARAELVGEGATTVFERDHNGYQAQWRHLHAVVTDDAPPLVPIEQAVDDLALALDLADRVDELLVPAP